MNTLNYLLQVNAYLLLFYLFYLVLLSNETFFKLNRFYLVTTALISLFIPLLQSDWIRSFFITEQVYQVTQSAAAIVIYDMGNTPKVESGWKIEDILWIIYLSGAAISLLIFIWKLYSLRKAVLQQEEKQAFSFFKTIVVDESLPQKETIEQHEQVHAAQWHSADVLFFELLAVLNWFNLVIYCFKKAIKNIHEFIADENAASHEKSKADYALILLNNSFGVPQYQLANSFFNQSLLKRRLLMLHKERSRRTAILKYGLSAPLFAAMLIFSSAMAAPAEIAKELKTRIQAIVKNAKPKADNSQDIPSSVSEIVRSDKEETDTAAKNLGQEYIRNLQRNIRYPAADRASQNTGRVICAFEIDGDGKITEVRIVKSMSETTAQEIRRVMNVIPDLSPKLKGKYLQPIKFVLHGSNGTTFNSDDFDTSEYREYTPLNEVVVVGYTVDEKASAGDTIKETPANFASIDVLPQFPGGQQGWAAYLSRNLKYPKEAKDKNIQGRITVSFVVEKDGSLTDVKVLRGIGYGYDEEAVRVVRNSPKWMPGKQDEKPVRVSYVMPIVFRLNAKPSQQTDTAYFQADTVYFKNTPGSIQETAIRTKSGGPPLLILDGKEIKIEEMKKLDPGTIEAIHVLKDKSAEDKYGDKGKNGVIEIKSRKKE